MGDRPDKSGSFRLFNRLSRKYDFLNHLFSAGQDIFWRRKAVRYLPEHFSGILLDVACGTGDFLLAALHARSAGSFPAVALDPARNMLRLARKKAGKRSGSHAILFTEGVATALPLPSNSASAVTIAFGIRNVANFRAGLREMYRVLHPGGRAILLEFSLPGNPVLKWIYLLYFRYILPVLGGLLSGDFPAYRYFNLTVEEFPYGQAFCEELERAGFCRVRHIPLTFGVATVYLGEKPEEAGRGG